MLDRSLFSWKDIPRSTPVEYNDDSHTYFRKHGHYRMTRIYRSATQIVERMHKEFNVEIESHRMAEKYGHTPAYWAAKWDHERDISCLRGNKLHQAKEDFLFGRGYDRLKGKDFRVENINLHRGMHVDSQGILDYHDHLPDGTYPELMVWRHDWGIAGRMDKPTIETIGSKRYLHIEDYKTNKKIGYSGWNDPEGERKMFAPLRHLPDCEFTHYSLQLSIYQYMGEFLGFLPGERRIIHFPHEIEGLGTPKPKTIEVPYLRNEVIDTMKYLKLKNWLN
jgi:hypothetical protein